MPKYVISEKGLAAATYEGQSVKDVVTQHMDGRSGPTVLTVYRVGSERTVSVETKTTTSIATVTKPVEEMAGV